MAKNASEPDDQALRERLEEVVATTTQREIARRTGVSNQNISHYLKGVRLPASFCSKLIRAYGVNPSWLMVGEGSPFLSDVSADTSEMAGDLLDLVKAMQAVSRRRLGALVGKNQLVALRELNDTLESFESLQSKVDKHSRPIFEHIVEEMREVFWEEEPDRLESLVRAGMQVSRLCHDQELQRNFKFRLANLYFRKRDYKRAHELYREVIFSHMASGEAITRELCSQMYQFVLAERSTFRIASASRSCDALIAMARDHGRDWHEYQMIAALGAYLEVELGGVKSSLPKLLEAHTQTAEDTRDSNTGIMLMHALYLSGASSIADVDALKMFEPVVKQMLVTYALWECDFDQIEELLAWKETHASQDVASAMIFLFAQLTLDTREPRSAAWFKKAQVRVEQAWEKEAMQGAHEPYMTPIFMGQVARLAHLEREARNCIEEAGDVIEAGRPEVMPPILWRAIHYRNVIHSMGAVQSKKARRLVGEAEDFFETHIAGGYHRFKKYRDVLE